MDIGEGLSRRLSVYEIGDINIAFVHHNRIRIPDGVHVSLCDTSYNSCNALSRHSALLTYEGTYVIDPKRLSIEAMEERSSVTGECNRISCLSSWYIHRDTVRTFDQFPLRELTEDDFDCQREMIRAYILNFCFVTYGVKTPWEDTRLATLLESLWYQT